MRRPDLKELRQAAELPLNRRKLCARGGFHHADHSGRALEQVRAANIADEDEVTAGQRDEIFCAGARVTNEIAQVLRRVARRVDRAEFDVPDRKLIAVTQEAMRIAALQQPLYCQSRPPSFEA